MTATWSARTARGGPSALGRPCAASRPGENGGGWLTREVAEAEAVAVAAMESSPMFGGVALRDLERDERGKG